MLTTTQQRETFGRDGVVCLRGVFSTREVARLAKSIDNATASIGTTATGYDITAIADAAWSDADAQYQVGRAEQYKLENFAAYVRATGAQRLCDRPAPASQSRGRFLVETGTWTRDRAFRSAATTSALPQIAGELLDARAIRFYDDQIFVKEAGTIDRTAFHQDLGYFNIEGDQGCVVWAPVDACGRQSGALGYVRGSHRWGKTFKPNTFMSRLTMPNAEGDELPDIDNNESDYDIVYFEVEPGDVVIHHLRTVHGSHGNASTTRTRRAASLRYVGEQVRYRKRPGAVAQPHRPLDWADGTALCDPWFPLAWRRSQAAVAAE
ncbi:MAG: phytanoyl-CoA dioxygenase family protein [Alphaproteobacteria bacterium]|nr:phytanoyl-CoA dioxygenase family protein [Alphaproteobacteria bacterium]